MAISDARAWIEVDLNAMRANYDVIRRAAGVEWIIPMVKADGYGLGARAAVRTFEPLDPWGYGVATASEGAALRSWGVTRPILVIAGMPLGELGLAARERLTASVSSLDGLEAWAAAAAAENVTLDFHVEVDTGMGRSGFDWREVGAWAGAIEGRITPALRWTGCFTHFLGADLPDPTASREQWERFDETLVQLPVPREALLVHASNSAAALRWPAYGLDAVRPGIFLYGGEPAPGVAGLPCPEPVASVRARLVAVWEKPAGTTLGYAATYRARGRERWGTVSIGYGDGLPRALGEGGTALVRGVRVPIIGRLSMDLMTVALDGVPDAATNDVVTLIGRDGEERITVEEVAERAGTISYEILTRLGPRLPRIELQAGSGGRRT